MRFPGNTSSASWVIPAFTRRTSPHSKSSKRGTASNSEYVRVTRWMRIGIWQVSLRLIEGASSQQAPAPAVLVRGCTERQTASEVEPRSQRRLRRRRGTTPSFPVRPDAARPVHSCRPAGAADAVLPPNRVRQTSCATLRDSPSNSTRKTAAGAIYATHCLRWSACPLCHPA